MIPFSMTKLSDIYTLSQRKLLENHTLQSVTYLNGSYMAVPPPPPPEVGRGLIWFNFYFLYLFIFVTKYPENIYIELLRLRSAGDNDRRSKRFCSMIPQCRALLKFHVPDSQNTRDQITSDRRSKRAWSKCVLCIYMSKRMLATYLRRMCNNNLEIRITGSSCRPQKDGVEEAWTGRLGLIWDPVSPLD